MPLPAEIIRIRTELEKAFALAYGMCTSIDSAWRRREDAREKLPGSVFALIGEYRNIVDNTGGIPADHYVYAPDNRGKNSDMIGYTASVADGRADKQKLLRLGRYLKKYFAIPDHEIEKIVRAYKAGTASADFTYRIVADTETINRAYETELCAEGSTYVSCMHGKFSGPTRPYHVYAHGEDAALAILERDGKIIARTVVSRLKHRFIRCYSVERKPEYCTQLEHFLRADGYEKGNLVGVRMRYIESCGRVLIPYFDGSASYATRDGNELVGTNYRDSADYECCNTDGEGVDLHRTACNDCGERVDDNELTCVGDAMICDHCLDHHYIYGWVDRRNQEYMSRDDAVEGCNGDYYASDISGAWSDSDGILHFECDHTTCACCDSILDGDSVLEVDSDNYCFECASTCAECDENFLSAETVVFDNADYCSEECAAAVRERAIATLSGELFPA
jgi:hypothetical protein